MVKDNAELREEKVILEKIRTLIDGDRIINFSDAVFAFAATLLVIRIDLPNISPDLLRNQFTVEMVKLIPVYITNFVSFIIIAYYWRLHHKLFILIKRYDAVLIWLNTILLIFVSFLPFPIDLFAEFSDISGVVIFYSISLAAVGFMLLAIWLYASNTHRLISQTMSNKVILYHTLVIGTAPFVFALSIPIALFDHVIAKITWIFVLVILYILDRSFRLNQLERAGYNPEPE